GNARRSAAAGSRSRERPRREQAAHRCAGFDASRGGDGMRVYVPATTVRLRDLESSGQLGAAPVTAFAVTPGLREWYVDDDVEALEYAALTEAARAALRLLDADPAAARRRGG